jgi:hypothetical protein
VKLVAIRRVTYAHKTVTKDYPDSPATDIMLTHHKAFTNAIESFKGEFGREPNYAELTVKYDVYLGLMQVELIEEIMPE